MADCLTESALSALLTPEFAWALGERRVPAIHPPDDDRPPMIGPC
jgi:hypothetical protein